LRLLAAAVGVGQMALWGAPTVAVTHPTNGLRAKLGERIGD
jgi:hypothetical protein